MKQLLLIVLALALVTMATSRTQAAPGDDFQRERKAGDTQRNQDTDGLEGKPAPRIADCPVWMNTPGNQPLQWEALKGKVVLIDFWGVWCGPCRAAIPHLKQLNQKYRDRGLVVIGIHNRSQVEKGQTYVRDEGILYAVGFDSNDQVVKRFHVNSFPDYYLVDHRGVLRMADLANKEVDRAVEFLLKEREADLAQPGRR